MKNQVSPALAVLAVVLTFGIVLTMYWKGLLGGPTDDAGGGGGGGGMPPPPITGLPGVNVTTLAGPLPNTRDSSDAGHQDGQSADVRFDGPSCLALTADGSLLVTDARNHRIRKIAPNGAASTIAGSGTTGSALGAFADGPADQARMWNPSGLAVAGSIFVTDTGNHRVRAIAGPNMRTVAGGETPKDRLGLADGAFADGPGSAARFRYPTGMAALPDGSCLVVDTGNKRLRKVSPDGAVTTVADLTAAGAKSPCGVAVLPDGRALITDPAAEAIFQVTPAGAVSALPGINKDVPIWIRPTGIAADATGTVYITDTGSHCIMRLQPGGAPQIIAGIVDIEFPSPSYSNGTGDSAAFSAPCAVVVASPGVLYVADYGNNCIRQLVIAPGT